MPDPETYKPLLKKGISMKCNYYDRSGQFVVSIEILPADCKMQSPPQTSM
ncbi:MAG: hypothetical protein JWO30_632 [Fibrobacteres bacterium]|nr:hypothetical protein [Fibrobacterota bacterium]